MTKKRRYRIGLQFVEAATVAMAILVTVIVTTKTLLTGIDLFDMAEQRHGTSRRTQETMQDLVTELLLLPPFALTSISETSLEWRDQEKKSVLYSLGIAEDTLALLRNRQLVAKNITLLDFDYRTWDGKPARDPKHVQRINVDLSIAVLRRGGTVRFRTEVFPRNAGYKGFTIEERMVGDTVSFLRAFYAAQAGIEYALRQLAEGRDPSGERMMSTSRFRVDVDQVLHRLSVRGFDGRSKVLLGISFP